MKAEQRRRAFALVLQGVSLRQAAKSVGISRSSIERWSAREGWQSHRFQAKLKEREEARAKYGKALSTSADLMADKLTRLFNAEYAALIAWQENGIGKKPKTSPLRLAMMALAINKVSLMEIDAFEAEQKFVLRDSKKRKRITIVNEAAD